MDLDLSGQSAPDKGKHWSGWRDLNSRLTSNFPYR